ncbi:Dihydrofolate reductase [Halomicronema hongdechloris C2206]|uniref:Dihydrofolate reductase n=1 Tax=Halomicronema hongdechloris C2206 TaxID=1641165 RepID=A0A1Z3HPP7_9CYAN|nr:dihydrofolate reductase family protein [Halomicronema hongdechloris]ASC72269.1 Dihydrofolate reductase [Halomicronema hongdechloris C2206]
MREVTYFVACSVDGFIAHADGSHDGFAQDSAYLQALFAAFPETLLTHFRAALGIHGENQRFDTVLMGRKTYEVGLKDGITNPYSHLQQYLFSRSMKTSPGEHVELVSDDAVEMVASLKQRPGKGIWLCGGATLATTLFANKLIDQLILKLNPFLIGPGIPLFSGVVQQTALDLTNQISYDNGVLLLQYQVSHFNR